ncbi:hypothetical protein BMS3Abin17_00760 [archaeon BMS3Abin17]|nr:hypothetical protein BMS3Abin17_00760 [archaeon BMS3Abin17]HDZ60868.1 hypothetical protein [Candidatus Pacearchaeota archaeon]
MTNKNISFILVLFLIFLTGNISAVSIVGVSPGDVNLKNVLRGGYAERYITVTIDSDDLVGIKLEARGDVKNWLEFPENFSVSKDSPGRILISVKPPSDIPNGNYTGFLRVSTESIGGEAKEEHATSNIRVAIDISINVEVTDLEIFECKASKFIVDSVEVGEDLLFGIDIFNQGNIRLKPEIQIDIWDQEQINIVKSVGMKSGEILPTREESRIFSVPTGDLEIGQYWGDVKVPDCFSSEILTFDILEEGALKAEGILLSIISKIWTDIDETIPIIATFKNIGEKEVDAQFKGKITNEGKIIQILESEKYSVPISEISNFSFFFTPRKAGKYIVSGRIFYDKKRTFESSTIINVNPEKFGIKQFFLTVIYIVLMAFMGYLIFKIRKEKKKYIKKIKRVKNEL